MDDMTEFQENYLRMLKEEEQEELANNADTISAFKKFMAQKGVVLTDENFKYFQTIGIVATYPNIISYLHPILVTDKEEWQLFLNEYGSQPVKSFSSSGTPYNIKLLKNGKELTSYGNMYSDRITTSDKKIIGLLKEGGTIKVYLRENSDYSIGSSYLFEFDATNYDKAINKLKK